LEPVLRGLLFRDPTAKQAAMISEIQKYVRVQPNSSFISKIKREVNSSSSSSYVSSSSSSSSYPSLSGFKATITLESVPSGNTQAPIPAPLLVTKLPAIQSRIQHLEALVFGGPLSADNPLLTKVLDLEVAIFGSSFSGEGGIIARVQFLEGGIGINPPLQTTIDTTSPAASI